MAHINKSINFGGGSMYGSMNPNKSILTQKSALSGLNTTTFYAKNPEAINVIIILVFSYL
jgi:hypothetical protein